MKVAIPERCQVNAKKTGKKTHSNIKSVPRPRSLVIIEHASPADVAAYETSGEQEVKTKSPARHSLDSGENRTDVASLLLMETSSLDNPILQ